MNGTLTIGQAAGAVGCNVRTIRYYEQIGLLPAAVRTDGNQRRFVVSDLRRLSFIRQARAFGFSLDEIRTMLELSDRPRQSCTAVTDIALARLAEVDRRLHRLAALRRQLAAMVAGCKGGEMSDCRIVEALAGDPGRGLNLQ
ncbi:helix-turn-helix domain-containing protein [Thalassobaculum sp.]|uniref:MerR family transcriptional regulator n=1 Tax=Thalassobaculum sp. TaxID=2022740 RepID=UPI0032EDC6D5